jgi:hypothetical protein
MLADLVEDALKAVLRGLDPKRTAMIVTDVTRGGAVRRCVEGAVPHYVTD